MKNNPAWFRNTIISICIAIALGLTSRYFNTLSRIIPNSTTEGQVTLDFIVGIGTLIFSIYLTTAFGLAQHEKNLKEMFQLIEDSNTFEVVGDAHRGLEAFIGMARTATAIDNTFIKFGPEDTLSSSKYPDSWPGNFIQVIADRASKPKGSGGARWRDIFSDDADRRIIIDTVKAKLNPNHGYEARLISDFPMTNFVIFRFPGNHAKVLFGWTGFQGLPDNIVFRSSHADVVAFFQECFDELYRKSSAYPAA